MHMARHQHIGMYAAIEFASRFMQIVQVTLVIFFGKKSRACDYCRVESHAEVCQQG